jgi:2-polyprenyl-6-methoxyphenol hydroxylase-like FAD-dependent oxidoreductase
VTGCGISTSPPPPRRGEAVDASGDAQVVVLGAGVAGLATALALAPHVDTVTIVDRDRLEDRPEPRQGVPQGRHVHVLLARGADALERLAPGLTGELVSAGAPVADWGARGRLTFGGHRLARAPLGRQSVAPSRPLLETHLRRRVAALSGVTVLDGCVAVAPTTSADHGRVTGVRVRSHDGPDQRRLAADLVVDCTGRATRTPVWLRDLGYDPPVTEEVRVDLRYASCHYRLPPDGLDGDVALICGATPGAPRGGSMHRIEGDRWIVTLAGLGESPPTDPAGFEDYAARLIDPDFHAALRRGEALDEPTPYRFVAPVRRHYERLRHLPAGLLVAGDAACSFNPVYGQGMSVAAMQAERLAALVADQGLPSPARWFRELARIVHAPWSLATGSDLARSQADRRRTLVTRLQTAYLSRYQAAAAHDPALAEQFARVVNLLDSPSQMVRPAVVRRVLLRRRPADNSSSSPGALTVTSSDPAPSGGNRARR